MISESDHPDRACRTPQPVYFSEQYAVRAHWVKRIISQFNLDPSICRDCFATPTNRRFDRFWTEEDDALAQEWSPAEIRWCNPPWSLWSRVASKILSSIGVSVAVMPAWYSQPWVRSLLQHAERSIYYEVGTRIFQLGDKASGGIRWGLYVLYINIQVPVFAESQVTTWSASSRRRYRRRLLKTTLRQQGCPRGIMEECPGSNWEGDLPGSQLLSVQRTTLDRAAPSTGRKAGEEWPRRRSSVMRS